MDDFLHNLRSGKLKQQGGGNRPFNDPQYKGGVRRNNPMDRRNKGHHDNKESTERLNAIKEVLENLDRTQKRMADAYIARTRAEERKARAMEILAKNLYKMLNPNAEDVDQLFAEEPAVIPETTEISIAADCKAAVDSVSEDLSDIQEETYPVAPTYSDSEESDEDINDEDEERTDDGNNAERDEDRPNSRGRLTEVDRHTLYSVINQMREAGEGWEKIARHIASQGYPTISGKGSWRGVMVKTLFEKMDE